MEKSFFKSSKILRKNIIARRKELGFSYNRIVDDSREFGINITKFNLSRYFNSPVVTPGYPTESMLLWLAFYFGINIRIFVEKGEYDENKIREKLKKLYGVENDNRQGSVNTRNDSSKRLDKGKKNKS